MLSVHKEYDVIVIGTGSARRLLEWLLEDDPTMKAAIIDKDQPGGICLTRGCIPSKLLLYPAQLLRDIESSEQFGITVDVKKVDFKKVMRRMRTIINRDIEYIEGSLKENTNVDYYRAEAEFTAPYTLRVGDQTIYSKLIILGLGSKPVKPKINGLEKVSYITSDSILDLERLPESVTIIGGGYVAAEYGHFLSSMGSKVTIVGRNPQFISNEEPEVSALAKRDLGKHMRIITNHEVQSVKQSPEGVSVTAVNRVTGEQVELSSESLMLASGRAPNTDILHPERAGIKTSESGWITVDEYLEASQKNIWAIGDSHGRHMFKHVANYDAYVAYSNLKEKTVKTDYSAVPHAVFTYPEIAGVGLREKEAVERYGPGNVLIGFEQYENTAKGEAMGVSDYFAKVIVEKGMMRIIGAHIIGPIAHVLIQEVVNLLYTKDRSAEPLIDAMHIHPGLSELVLGAFNSLMTPEEYRRELETLNLLPS